MTSQDAYMSLAEILSLLLAASVALNVAMIAYLIARSAGLTAGRGSGYVCTARKFTNSTSCCGRA